MLRNLRSSVTAVVASVAGPASESNYIIYTVSNKYVSYRTQTALLGGLNVSGRQYCAPKIVGASVPHQPFFVSEKVDEFSFHMV